MGLRSGKTLFRIPDQGVKKTPDPGSGSATLPSPAENFNSQALFSQSGFVPLTSGSGWHQNMRIRIPNTDFRDKKSLTREI